MKLTVIILDNGAMICGAADRGTKRTVVIELTPEQNKQLELKQVATVGKSVFYETIEQAILEN